MKKTLYRVVMIDYPMQNEVVLSRTFDNFKDADNYAFGKNMNRTTSKCEFKVKQCEIDF